MGVTLLEYGCFSTSLVDLLVPYVVTGWAGYLSWRVVRAYERRGTAPDRLDPVAERVRILEDTVGEVAEAQRFTTALLLGRAEKR